MPVQDPEIIRSDSNELHEMRADAATYGNALASQTIAWLKPWWTEAGLPTREPSGFPILSNDMLAHAGAVTSIGLWEKHGFSSSIGPHILPLGDALHSFVKRVLSADQERYISNDGAALRTKVLEFEQAYRVPATMDRLDEGSVVAMKANPPSADGLDLLAELLLDFSHVLKTN